MAVVLLTGDLMVMSRVAGVAAQHGIALHTASNAQQAAQLCGEHSAEALLMDLALASLDVTELVRVVAGKKISALTIIAFGPHVHEERLAAAREAGCDEVVNRGQFFSQLAAILGRYGAR